jgi:nucleoside-diphosphate-sugar epimerase
MIDAANWTAGATRFRPEALRRTYAKRGFAMPMSGAWPAGRLSPANVPLSPIDRVVPTVVLGGAGMLGARLVEQLLRAPDRGDVIVISRKPEALQDRLRDVYGAEAGSRIYADPRLQLMSADIAAPDFAAHFDIPEVGVIYNLAAQVDAFASLDQLIPANCVGAKAASTIASITGARLVHASTLSVFASADGGDESLEDWLPDDPNISIRGGYAQSKAIAETTIAQHQARYGNAAAVRLGLLVPDGLQPNEPGSFLTSFIRGLALIGVVPDDAEEAYVDMTPIDQAAAMMLAVGDEGGTGVFHYACENTLSLTQAVRIINAHEPLRPVSRSEWHEALKDLPSLVSAVLQMAFHKSDCLDGRCSSRPILNADLFQSTARTWGSSCALDLGVEPPRCAVETFAAIAARELEPVACRT